MRAGDLFLLNQATKDPAYVSLMLEALTGASVYVGLSRATASRPASGAQRKAQPRRTEQTGPATTAIGEPSTLLTGHQHRWDNINPGQPVNTDQPKGAHHR